MANTLTLPRPLNMSDLDSLQTATASFGRAIAFIDTAVPDYQMLANGVIPGIEVVLLDPHSAIKQITLALKNRTFSAVHIVSHGVPGGLQLGYLDFSWENLHRNLYLAVAVKQWGASLTPNAEILLYGCNVAARRRGIAFVERLNLLTGAKIAASARPTGSAAKGGDWELEVTTGEMRVPKAFKPEVMATYSHILTGFGAANNFPVGSSPIGEIAEDFNGDGLVDLAVLQNGTQASLLLGNGNGTFGPATPVGTGTFGSHVDFVAKDFNGDGQLDLAVAKQNGGGEFPSSSISIALGTNAGQFAPPSTINLQLSSLAAIETADFNNDGNADLAVTNSFGNNVQILLGTGQGTFGNATEFDVGDNPAAIAVGDLNNDGNQDLAITDLSAHNVSVLLGDGTGGFGSATEFFGGGTSPNAVAIGDVDGDNNLDLVVAYTASNNISVLLGTGTGKFDAPIFFNTGQAPDDLILADFDADNNLDVATANSGSNNISFLLGTGTGSFGTATSLAVGANPRAILASDLNGDNRLDLVVANSGASNLSVLLNNVVNFGAATFSGVEGSTDTIVTIPVSLAALPTNNVTIAIGIDPSSTATNITDYSLSTTSLTFTPNATALTQNIEVTIKADNLPENAETVVLKLGDIIGASAGNTNQATLTIEPNGTLSYAVTAGIDTIKEGDAGSKPLTFTVARSGDTGASSSVDYAIAGTAADGSDYNNIGGTSGAAGLTGTINFAAGETSKTVTLDVLGDTVVEADETVSVTLSNPTGPATTPTISNPTATTTILNDDVIGVNIAPASTTATEGGTTGSYNLSLKSQPTDVVTINFNPGTQLKPIDPLKFTPTDWNIPQTVTVGAIDDSNAEGPHTATIAHSLVSNDPNYNGLAIAGVDVAIGDNDKPGVSIAPSSLKVGEGGPTANLTVSLTTQPKDPVTVKLGTTDNQLEPLGSVTFDNTNWNTPQSVTVKAVDDAVVEGDHASTIIFTTSSADTEYNALVIPPTSVAIADNDSTPTPTPTPTPTFTPTPTPIPTPTPTFTPTPTPIPTPTPTFTPTPTPQLFIPPGSFLPLNPTPTPTPTPTTNPFLPPIPPFIITPPAIPAGITVSPTSNLTTTEAGGTAQFTVKLNTKPTANVKVDLGSSDTSEGIISPVSLSFTPDNWNQPQTVKVEGVNDLLPDGNQNYTIITSPAISTDPKYAGLNASDVSVTNLDNEPGGFTILPPNLNRSNVPYKAGELLVKLKPGSNNEAIQSAFQVNGALAIENLIPPTEQASAKPRRLDRWRIVKFASDADLLEIKRLLAQDPRIEAVQLNYEESINAVPNDTDFGSLWGLNNTGASGGTPDADIDAPEAWDIETGDSNVIVAVIDSGVDYNHQDLAANMWVNTGEIAGNGIDDDGNGYVDDRQGYDFVNNDNNPMDDNSHGSHVAGTVGAVGNNNLGVVGVNQTVKLMPLKFLGAGGTGSVANAAQAIRYATDKGADVINYSAGGYRPPDFDPTTDVRYDAIADAGDAGVLFVAAAGNDTNDNDTNAFYPAGFNLPNVVSVAATTRNDGLAGYSNFGSTTVDLGAPGSTILSTIPGNLYGNKSGTSMASPHVAGAAALLLAQNPGRTPAQLKDILMTTVDPLPALAGTTVSGGRLNLRDALNRTPIVNKSVFGQSQAGGFSQAGNTFVMAANSYTDPDPGDSISYSIALADKNSINASDFTIAFGLDGKSYRKPNSNSFPSIPLPGWLTFNAATRTININPATRPTTFDYWMKVTGTDVSGASVSEIIRFKSYALGGFVIDGYISGASVFLDVNKNGRLDANEPTTTSDANGQFSLDADFSGFDKNENGEIDSEEGNIVAIGGTDTATGLPLETPVTAPPDATVVTLLTTLVADLIDRGVDPDTAESQVKAALSLPANIELISLDPIAATENNVPGGVEVFSAMVKAQNFITQTASLIDGASSADRTDIVKAVTGAIASQIQGGASLNLSDANQLNSAIQQAIAKTQQIDSALNVQQLLSISSLVATVMAEANQRIDAVVSATPSGSVGREMARVQKVSLGETTQDFLAVGAGSKSIQDAIAENTGAALTAQIQAAVLPSGPGGAVLGGDTEVTTTASDGLSGTESDDILTGGSSNDVITGKRGNDNLSGLEGNDWIHGNQGNDSLDGGTGDDSLYGGKGNDNLLGGDGQDVLFGNRAQDTLIGGEGGDSLYGGKGFDTLLGGGGDDFLSGDLGEDALIGGTGNDRFVLTPGTGTDSIVDFEVGQDSLVLGNGVTFAQLAITQADNATLIQFVPTGQILVSLQGVSANQIGPSNFSFL